MRVGTPMPVRVANPLVDYSYNIFAMLATHDTLVRFDAAMRPQPQLALAWKASADGRQWRFLLRSDARWHDGRPVTAGDVKFTFEYLMAHHGASAWMQTLISRIQADDATVTFDLTKPHSRFLINCGFIVRILPKHVWETVADPFKPGDARVTMGCGPFVFQSLDLHAGRLEFRRNNAYHGPLPTVSGLSIFLNRPFDALALSLRRGDLDLYYKYASGFPPSHLAVLFSTPDLRLPEADALGIPAALGFNLKRRPADDADFRKAIAAALDYDRLTASLMGSQGKVPDRGFLPPAFGNGPADMVLAHDPEESGRRLECAGYTDTDGDGLRNLPGGGNIALTLLARADLAGTDALLPIISHNLKAVGLCLKIERVDLSTWIDRVHGDRFDLVMFRTTPWGMVMDAGVASGYFDSRRRGGGTLANVTDPIFHDLCDRLLATTDPVRQAGLQQAIQRYYAEHLPAVALCWAVNTYPVRRSWQGLTINQLEGGLLNRQTFAGIYRSTPGKQDP
ncbi:peptide ABC transporter substrate-binding protein [Desulfosarcina ovata subsp. sediminis]|uniref:Peptide ABC transporter substrate-binding protein n=1 Tax=Desulfosarcina ovata subsp. sediminis TaxID=885957 RepID=A0A5K7ZP86_9BACT|nr:peptide ABC transporter substrate-binding protein [Desulfosarcina ovata subsp. sediminis]